MRTAHFKDFQFWESTLWSSVNRICLSSRCTPQTVKSVIICHHMWPLHTGFVQMIFKNNNIFGTSYWKWVILCRMRIWRCKKNVTFFVWNWSWYSSSSSMQRCYMDSFPNSWDQNSCQHFFYVHLISPWCISLFNTSREWAETPARLSESQLPDFHYPLIKGSYHNSTRSELPGYYSFTHLKRDENFREKSNES